MKAEGDATKVSSELRVVRSVCYTSAALRADEMRSVGTNACGKRGGVIKRGLAPSAHLAAPRQKPSFARCLSPFNDGPSRSGSSQPVGATQTRIVSRVSVVVLCPLGIFVTRDLQLSPPLPGLSLCGGHRPSGCRNLLARPSSPRLADGIVPPRPSGRRHPTAA